MENMHRARTRRQKCSASMLSPGIPLSTSQCGHQHWSSPNLFPKGFLLSPPMRLLRRLHSVGITDEIISSWWSNSDPEIPRVLGTVCQDQWKRPDIFFSYIIASLALGYKEVFGQHFNRWNHERGKRQNPWRIRVTGWMDRKKVKLDPKISCYSHGYKPGTTLKWDTKTLEEQKGPVLVPAF